MSNRFTRIALVFAAASLIGPCTGQPASAQTKPASLSAILAQMNAASAKFTSAQADLRQETFDHILRDTETKTGQIYFLRQGVSTQMGMKMSAPDAAPGSPAAQILEFKDGKLRLLTTGTGQVDVFNATGKNQALAETLVTLGFGGSGADLQKAWTITDGGAEALKDGNQSIETEKLDLVSKDAAIRNNYSRITIWVDPVRDVSLKQLLYMADGGTPTGDTKTVYFSNIHSNQKVNTGPFAIKCKGKCTVVNH